MTSAATIAQNRVETRQNEAIGSKMGKVAWIVGCAFPYASFGRLSVPKRRLRYQDGHIRFTESRDGQRLLCFLVNEFDQLIYGENQIDALLKSKRLGTAVQYYLERHNHYEPGEHPGDRQQVVVGG